MRQQGLAKRSHGLGRPAPANVIDPPKAFLVLKHPSEGGAFGPVLADTEERFGAFFPVILGFRIALGGVFYPGRVCASDAGATV